MRLSVFKYLTWVGQLGLSLVVPPVLALWFGVWLQGRFRLGGWVVALALALGLFGSLQCLLRFLKMVQKEADREHADRKLQEADRGRADRKLQETDRERADRKP